MYNVQFTKYYTSYLVNSFLPKKKDIKYVINNIKIHYIKYKYITKIKWDMINSQW